MLLDSGRPVIVVQHAAQTLSSLDRACVSHMAWFRADELIAYTLMMPFRMVMRHELGNRSSQRALTKQDHPL
jgi:hypothetical protein